MLGFDWKSLVFKGSQAIIGGEGLGKVGLENGGEYMAKEWEERSVRLIRFMEFDKTGMGGQDWDVGHISNRVKVIEMVFRGKGDDSEGGFGGEF